MPDKNDLNKSLRRIKALVMNIDARDVIKSASSSLFTFVSADKAGEFSQT